MHVKAPCLNCKERYNYVDKDNYVHNCHSTCSKFIQYQKEHLVELELIKKQRTKYMSVDNYNYRVTH
jgi:hypothetical protein